MISHNHRQPNVRQTPVPRRSVTLRLVLALACTVLLINYWRVHPAPFTSNFPTPTFEGLAVVGVPYHVGLLATQPAVDVRSAEVVLTDGSVPVAASISVCQRRPGVGSLARLRATSPRSVPTSRARSGEISLSSETTPTSSSPSCHCKWAQSRYEEYASGSTRVCGGGVNTLGPLCVSRPSRSCRSSRPNLLANQ